MAATHELGACNERHKLLDRISMNWSQPKLHVSVTMNVTEPRERCTQLWQETSLLSADNEFWISDTAQQAGRSRVPFPIESEIFHWFNSSGRTVALGSTQPLTEISTRDLPRGVKVAGAHGSQPCDLHMPTVWKSWEPQPPGAFGTYIGLYRESFTFYLPGYEVDYIIKRRASC